LCKPRDLNELRQEIVAMRQKMLDTHPNDCDMFDIKHDRGGMVDIEFIVQFLILAHAHTEPKLTANSGNLALLMLAGELGLIKVELAEAASNCYRTLRALQHKMRLNNQSPCRVDRKSIDTTSVITLWEELLGPHCQEKK
jgi:glutamate-ammonia-ligase adenylyltransferase